MQESVNGEKERYNGGLQRTWSVLGGTGPQHPGALWAEVDLRLSSKRLTPNIQNWNFFFVKGG